MEGLLRPSRAASWIAYLESDASELCAMLEGDMRATASLNSMLKYPTNC
jgi:hypothetical protein